MGNHESSVNYQNLIKDLADMYPFEVAEVIIVELIANSLDSRATTIQIDYQPNEKVLLISDNGKGMSSTDFEQYHDFAAGLKTRGMGIGFAGVGAKISFNIATRVLTETFSENYSGGSNWYLKSKRSLIWDDIQPSHLKQNGTRVEVLFNAEAPISYSTTKDIIRILKRHYLPLLDEKFLALYDALGYYPKELRFIINGQLINPIHMEKEFALEKVNEFLPKVTGKRIGFGIIGLSTIDYPLSSDICGLVLCTRGKVIKADMFNQFPGEFGPRILGVAEVPGFIDFLTSAKTDFMSGRKSREFEKLYNPFRQEFKNWLKDLGVPIQDVVETNEALKLERELKRLLDDIPELGEFFGFRTKKNILQRNTGGTTNAITQNGIEPTYPIGDGESGAGTGPVDIGNAEGEALEASEENAVIKATPITRTARLGPKIGLLKADNRTELSWVEGNNIVINIAHPAYKKISSNSQARRLHCIYAIAFAIQKFISESRTDYLSFPDRMLKAWGEK